MEWQPISTAPKDRRILLYYPDPIFTDHEIMTGKWDADEYAKKPRPHWTNDASWLRTSMARASADALDAATRSANRASRRARRG